MAVTVDCNKNITLKQDDSICLSISMIGNYKAQVGDTCKFMVKTNVSDIDGDAVLSEDITIVTEGIIPINVSSLRTSVLSAGTYYWSLKLTSGGNQQTIIPDDGDEGFPTFIVEEVLING